MVALNGPCALVREMQGEDDAQSDPSARQSCAAIYSDVLQWTRTLHGCTTHDDTTTNPTTIKIQNNANSKLHKPIIYHMFRGMILILLIECLSRVNLSTGPPSSH